MTLNLPRAKSMVLADLAQGIRERSWIPSQLQKDILDAIERKSPELIILVPYLFQRRDEPFEKYLMEISADVKQELGIYIADDDACVAMLDRIAKESPNLSELCQSAKTFFSTPEGEPLSEFPHVPLAKAIQNHPRHIQAMVCECCSYIDSQIQEANAQ